MFKYYLGTIVPNENGGLITYWTSAIPEELKSYVTEMTQMTNVSRECIYMRSLSYDEKLYHVLMYGKYQSPKEGMSKNDRGFFYPVVMVALDNGSNEYIKYFFERVIIMDAALLKYNCEKAQLLTGRSEPEKADTLEKSFFADLHQMTKDNIPVYEHMGSWEHREKGILPFVKERLYQLDPKEINFSFCCPYIAGQEVCSLNIIGEDELPYLEKSISYKDALRLGKREMESKPAKNLPKEVKKEAKKEVRKRVKRVFNGGQFMENIYLFLRDALLIATCFNYLLATSSAAPLLIGEEWRAEIAAFMTKSMMPFSLLLMGMAAVFMIFSLIRLIRKTAACFQKEEEEE